jgi:hypothetical protein
MPRICLSYRRSDSAAIVGRIYDRLAARYGADAVFMDVTAIPYGADFRDRILKAWQGAEVLIAVIGPGWVGQKKDTPARIHERLDPVRAEIETALRRRMLIIPVLVDGANMPNADELPRGVRKLADRNGMPVDASLDFEPHIQRLLSAIDLALGIETAVKPDATRGHGPTLQSDLASRNEPSFGRFRSTLRSMQQLLPYFLVPVVLLLLAHYLIVITLDRDTIYLRPFAAIVPLASGYLLFRGPRLGVAAATLLGLCIALVAVGGMMTVVGSVDQHAILPQSEAGWQEAAEFVVTITLAAAAGNLLARALLSIPAHWRLF